MMMNLNVEFSMWFKVTIGVQQGCFLSPTVFNLLNWTKNSQTISDMLMIQHFFFCDFQQTSHLNHSEMGYESQSNQSNQMQNYIH